LKGEPLYARRFDAVQKYHAPGLAPVRDDSGAYHIHSNGEAAYLARFNQTWGFYEGLASVEVDDGWFHILPDGSPLSNRRFDWCGNFQDGRCAVRFGDGLYGHIKVGGTLAYEDRHLYAGDFRDGIAVVRYVENGLCGHIDDSGRPIHSHRYLDLDVFHKGYARAKDERGWFHVHLDGTPAYAGHFAAVEPFYNGQARILTNDGEYQVVDVQSRTLASVGRDSHDRFHQLSAALVGHWRTDTIAAAVSFGVFEHLPARCADMAEAIAVPEDSLSRLLGALWELGLVDRRDGGLWQATPIGQLLDPKSSPNLADAAMEYGGPLRECWSHLREAIRTTQWRPPDVFAGAASDPARVAALQRMLAAYAQHDYASIVRMLPFGHTRTIVDVAGGTGVLARMLADQFTAAEVVVLERPEVCELGGESCNHPRVKFVSGNLFKPWPVRTDAFVMSRVLHDWSDDRARQVLEHARDAVPLGSTGIILEMLLDDASPFGRVCDLHLMLVTGGRERTTDQYDQLARETGFRLVRVEPTGSIVNAVILEAI
jgi:O-methyltransferase